MRKLITFTIAYLLVLFVFWKSELIQFEFLESTILQFFSGMAIHQEGGINIFYFIAYYGLSDFYINLYSFCFWFPWYETLYFLLSYIGIYFLYRSYYEPFSRRGKVYQISFIFIFFVLFLVVLLPIQYTKLAFVLCFSSFSNLFFRKKSNLNFFISSSLFVLGLMVRIEVGVLVFLLSILYFVFDRNWEIHKMFYILFIAIVLGFVSFKVSHEIKYSNEYLKQLEPSLAYQLLDRENIVSLKSLDNPVEQAKYVAFQNSISDPQIITIDFLKSLIQKHEVLGFSWKLFNRATNIMISSVLESRSLFIFYIFFVILYLVYGSNFYRVLLFNFLLLSFTFSICYFIKMEIWLFHILLVSFVFFNFSLFGLKSLDRIPRKFLFSLVLLILLILNSLIVRSEELNNKMVQSMILSEKLSEEYTNKIIIPDISLFIYLMNNHKAFEASFLRKCHFIYLDQDVLFWEKEYNNFVSKKYGINSSNLKEFFIDVSKRENILFVLRESREQVYKDYFKVVLKSQIKFIKVEDFEFNGNIYKTLKLSHESSFN